MAESNWDIQEVKDLKKKRLFHIDIMVFFMLVLLAFYIEAGGRGDVLLGLCCAFLWLWAASMFYSVKTGKAFGTTTNQLVQDFDREQKGEKQWKRKTIGEAVFLSIAALGFTILLVVLDFNSPSLSFTPIAFSIIANWVGFNIGELVRMNNL
jgi:Ca2+/Na+ antiporter